MQRLLRVGHVAEILQNLARTCQPAYFVDQAIEMQGTTHKRPGGRRTEGIPPGTYIF